MHGEEREKAPEEEAKDQEECWPFFPCPPISSLTDGLRKKADATAATGN